MSDLDHTSLFYIFTEELYDLPQVEITIPQKEIKTLILLNNKEENKIPEQEVLLQKILHAVQVKPEESLILYFQDHSAASFAQLKQHLSPEFLLCFGLTEKDLRLNFKAQSYRSYTILDVKILFSDALGVIETNVGRKKILWGALKPFFNLT